MTSSNGGPAFPRGYGFCDKCELDGGMSLRDYFAAAAMQAAIREMDAGTPVKMEFLAKMSYDMADAMLTERNKR